MAWSTPKTDWYGKTNNGVYTGDYFNAVDFNRIKNNLEYLHTKAVALYGDFSIETVDDKAIGDMFYADEINDLETNFDIINANTLNLSYGTAPTYEVYGKAMDYVELNRLESAILDLYERLSLVVIIPSQNGTLTYSGNEQSPTWDGYDSSVVAISGTTKATNAGSYTTTFTLKDTVSHSWSDGTTAPKSVTWTIEKASPSLKLSKSSLTLSYDYATGTITVTRSGDGAITAKSSKTSVVIVSTSGTTVTVQTCGVSNSSATVTVTVAETANYTAQSATCSVLVPITLGNVSVGSTFTINNTSGTAVKHLVLAHNYPLSGYTLVMCCTQQTASKYSTVTYNTPYADSIIDTAAQNKISNYGTAVQNLMGTASIKVMSSTSATTTIQRKMFLLSLAEINPPDGTDSNGSIGTDGTALSSTAISAIYALMNIRSSLTESNNNYWTRSVHVSSIYNDGVGYVYKTSAGKQLYSYDRIANNRSYSWFYCFVLKNSVNISNGKLTL